MGLSLLGEPWEVPRAPVLLALQFGSQPWTELGQGGESKN